MTFNDYQKLSRPFSRYPDIDNNLIYPVLGFVGEAGEIANKLQKVIRDSNYQITEETQEAILQEIGDSLWFMAQICSEMKVSLDDVAQKNIDKLSSRQNRDTLRGSGDYR